MTAVFSTAGSGDWIWDVPCFWISGSETPNASTRLRMTLIARRIESSLTSAFAVGLALQITCAPPLRSRPSTVGFTAITTIDPASRPSTTRTNIRGPLAKAHMRLVTLKRWSTRSRLRRLPVVTTWPIDRSGDPDLGVLRDLDQHRAAVLDLGHRPVHAGHGDDLVARP